MPADFPMLKINKVEIIKSSRNYFFSFVDKAYCLWIKYFRALLSIIR